MSLQGLHSDTNNTKRPLLLTVILIPVKICLSQQTPFWATSFIPVTPQSPTCWVEETSCLTETCLVAWFYSHFGCWVPWRESQRIHLITNTRPKHLRLPQPHEQAFLNSHLPSLLADRWILTKAPLMPDAQQAGTNSCSFPGEKAQSSTTASATMTQNLHPSSLISGAWQWGWGSERGRVPGVWDTALQWVHAARAALPPPLCLCWTLTHCSLWGKQL